VGQRTSCSQKKELGLPWWLKYSMGLDKGAGCEGLISVAEIAIVYWSV
jgi:hypothetical protein